MNGKLVIETVAVILACLGGAYILNGCTPATQAEAARKAYEAEIAACAASAPTVEASGECRKAVKAKWGIE